MNETTSDLKELDDAVKELVKLGIYSIYTTDNPDIPYILYIPAPARSTFYKFKREVKDPSYIFELDRSGKVVALGKDLKDYNTINVIIRS